MAYFIILPVWVLVLLGMAALTVATRMVPRWSPIFPYAWRVLLWSSVGFLVANALLWLGEAAIVGAGRPADAEQSGPAALQAALGLALILGPVIASMAGFGTGTGVALFLARRRAAKGQPQSQSPERRRADGASILWLLPMSRASRASGRAEVQPP